MKAVSPSIREARSDDVDRIVEIERSWEHLSHWSLDAYYRLIDDDRFTSTFVAELEEERDNVIVGFVIFHVADHAAEIYNIAVDNAHRRLGVGGMLMQTVIGQSRRRGARKVVLEVRKSNHGAIRFYSEFNFRVSGERHNYYSNPPEDAYVMDRDLRMGTGRSFPR
jgi:ribosomal-protein-alanine acetyltransferase